MIKLIFIITIYNTLIRETYLAMNSTRKDNPGKDASSNSPATILEKSNNKDKEVKVNVWTIPKAPYVVNSTSRAPALTVPRYHCRCSQ